MDTLGDEEKNQEKKQSLIKIYTGQKKEIEERADQAINNLEKGNNKDHNKEPDKTKKGKDVKSSSKSEKPVETPTGDPSSVNAQNSSDCQTDTPKVSNVPDKAYIEKRYCKLPVRTLGLAGLDSTVCSSGEKAHPNSLTELKPSSHWTVLIGETGSFSSKDSSSTNLPDRVVGIFVPDDVVLPEYSVHACREKSFSKIETIVQLLLNSRCGILDISVNAFNNGGGKSAWVHAIELLLELAAHIIPHDKDNETFFEVLVEQRCEFDVKTDGSLISDHVIRKIAETDSDLAKRFKIKCRIVPKNGLLSYPDVVANLWNSSQYKNLRNYTCWENACLLNESPHGWDIKQTVLMLTKRSILPVEWEKLLPFATTTLGISSIYC